MAKQKTQEHFHQEVIDKYPLLPDGRPEYDPSEFEYLGTSEKGWLTHNVCGNRFQIRPYKFSQNNGCNNPDCIKDKRKATNLRNSGVEHNSQNQEVKDNKRKTNLRNLGVEYPSQKDIIPILHLLDDPEWMYNQYITQNKTSYIIADELSLICSVSHSTIWKCLKKHNITRRKDNQWFSYAGCHMMETLSIELDIQIQHALNGKEFKIPGTKYSFDGYCQKFNIGIEYNGSHIHGNPRKYKPEDQCHHKSKLTAIELQEKDTIRLAKIMELGYNVFVIWDDEWKENPQEVIMKLRNFINKIKI